MDYVQELLKIQEKKGNSQNSSEVKNLKELETQEINKLKMVEGKYSELPDIDSQSEEAKIVEEMAKKREDLMKK